ncbi:MAG: Uma2 family endonuclease [Planctomycetes bacterium]|nr:Uma2 family endonuclease [Planctomycetota bacterium]
MATVSSIPPLTKNDYPTASKKPMPETDWHRKLMNVLIEILTHFYQAQPRVYVSGNLLLFYQRGNKRRHVSPDVFVVKGVAKGDRDNYLLWEEGKGPDIVIELTSSSTRKEDLTKKFNLYQNTLKVKEYFLFDPHGDYLDPPLQGYRLRKGVYQPIRPVQGRLPSRVLGLHLERDGKQLQLVDPVTGQWLLPPEVAQQQRAERAERAEQQERLARQQERQAREQAERAQQQERQAREQAEQAQQRAELARQQAEAETERLRREIEALRR